MWRRIGIIARREFLYTVKRREFLMVTLGLPILYVFLIFLVGAATATAVRSSAAGSKPQPKAVGFLDRSGKLDRATLGETRDGIAGKLFETVEAGQKAVKDNEVRAFVVVAEDFDRTGRVTVYAPAKKGSVFGPDSRRGGGPGNYTATLRRAALAGKAPPDAVDRVLREVNTRTLNYDPETATFAAPNMFSQIGKFAVPYAFSLLLMMSVLMGASYLLHGIVEEKENRVIEVLLSAASHEELLGGKIIGLGAAGLLQLFIWVGGALVTVAFVALRNPQIAALSAGPGVIATALIMFLLGFCLYAALMGGVGSLGTSWKESQQMSGSAVMPLVLPLMLLPVFLEQPDGGVARGFSLFPLTAPIAMMLRVAAGGASVWEVALAAALLAVTVVLVVKLAARLFRLSLLMYGQRPDTRLVLRHLFTRG